MQSIERIFRNVQLPCRATLACDQSGAVMVEYALVLATLSFLFMAGLAQFESALATALTNVQSELMDYVLENGQ